MVDKTSELYDDQSCKEIKGKGHVIITSQLKKKVSTPTSIMLLHH